MQEQLLGNASLNVPDLVSEDFFLSNKSPSCFLTTGDPHKRNWSSGSTSNPGGGGSGSGSFTTLKQALTAGQSEGRD